MSVGDAELEWTNVQVRRLVRRLISREKLERIVAPLIQDGNDSDVIVGKRLLNGFRFIFYSLALSFDGADEDFENLIVEVIDQLKYIS